jgi:non-ribosomal peptide synthetase component F
VADGASIAKSYDPFVFRIQPKSIGSGGAVGVPIAGRNRPELEGMIGFFVNTLVLRGDLAGDPPFTELLRRVRNMALDAYSNGDLSFDRVVQALRPGRDPSRTPLFQVLFNSLEFNGRRRFELPGVTAEFRGAAPATAKFDLTVYLGNDEDATVLLANYNADLFRPERMEELLAQVESVLDGLCLFFPLLLIGGRRGRRTA